MFAKLALVALSLMLLSVPARAQTAGRPDVARITAHLRAAKSLESSDAVEAFRHLREAMRLEQLWSGNTLGEDSPASMAMQRFTESLVRKDDNRLLKILHGRNVALPDKLNLIHALEQEIILNYPGTGSNRLLQDYGDE